MKWLLTYPEDGPSVSFYRNWLMSGGVDSELIPPEFPHPGDIKPFSALLLPGGGDVDPKRYGDHQVHPKTYEVSPVRDDLEVRLIEEFLAAGKPVFGICRGLQILNVAQGGKLIQHVPDFLGPASTETHSKKGSYDSRHPVELKNSTRLARALGTVEEVNSSHHQAAHPDHIGRGLRVAAVSPGGVIEALECFDRAAPIVAVQWHPERLQADHPASRRLLAFFKSFVR